ncbi:LysR family transcriptional regulator [Shewanella sp. CG12_big_fil_rev_8_21_14_0_65_47_15]|uniref:LysR family transcriptional regulator n=1 Tax=Shewanella sp. CG12_big_fil_rev_8_21_14_0_65_47_15 TaxID=1975537 RepID=UPI000CC88F99|nr:LysR family transcriptional regulator [Shewanella sp. CG12_big_fil_rev_8_21_14_0_65_47_15]PIW61943.1 MAG: LysR family transcriptional regulator [Shewanella sp. CG12_big_fil_rev_8_21_14_0_65_47_15]
MDLKVLRYFIEIVDAGGFGKASEKLHLTQPTLSKALRQLEEELDLVLLERGKRGTQVKLTQAGEVVYRHGKELLTGRQRMLAELSAQRSLTAGELKLGLAPLGSAEIFAPIIAKYRQQYPQIDMHLLVRGGVEQTSAIQKGEIELATGIINFDQGYDGIRIFNDPMVVVLPRENTLASRAILSIIDLKEQPQVMFETEYTLYQLVLTACQLAGFTPQNITRVSQADFGIALVAAGTGVMILPRSIARRYSVSGVVNIPLASDELRWELSLFWRRDQILSFAARAMITLVEKHLADK